MKLRIDRPQFERLRDAGVFYKSDNGNEYVPKDIGRLWEWCCRGRCVTISTLNSDTIASWHRENTGVVTCTQLELIDTLVDLAELIAKETT